MRNRILIGMGTSLLDGAGRVRPGSTLGTIEALSEQANAQTLHDHPDTAPSQLLALNTNLLPSVFWDKDQTSLKLPNPDGATSFFVNLADTDAMARVLESEGYQGQDASGTIRQQTFAHEAVREATFCYRFDSFLRPANGGEEQVSVTSTNDFEWREAA